MLAADRQAQTSIPRAVEAAEEGATVSAFVRIDELLAERGAGPSGVELDSP